MVNRKLMMKSMKAIVVLIVTMRMVDTKLMTKSMRWMVVIVVMMKDEDGGNKMDENDVVISTLSVSPSGLTKSSKIDLRLDTVHKLGKKLVMVESNVEFILYCLTRSLCPHQKTVTGGTVVPNLCTHGGKSTVGQYMSILQSHVLDPNKDSFLIALQLLGLKKEIDTDYMEEKLKDLKQLGEEMYSMREMVKKICKLTSSMQFILCTHDKNLPCTDKWSCRGVEK